ncbi:MAG: hypothetical protein HQ475_13595 [SAR202 cluster bacterium]|nr:hypothetical protein [SAR202 cluster bacterium]
MSNFIIMNCSLGHIWIVPINGTSRVVFPNGCRKCIKVPNPLITATVEFRDNGAPSVVIDKQ